MVIHSTLRVLKTTCKLETKYQKISFKNQFFTFAKQCKDVYYNFFFLFFKCFALRLKTKRRMFIREFKTFRYIRNNLRRRKVPFNQRGLDEFFTLANKE